MGSGAPSLEHARFRRHVVVPVHWYTYHARNVRQGIVLRRNESMCASTYMLSGLQLPPFSCSTASTIYDGMVLGYDVRDVTAIPEFLA